MKMEHEENKHQPATDLPEVLTQSSVSCRSPFTWMLRASAITFSDLSRSAGSDVCEPSHEVNWA